MSDIKSDQLIKYFSQNKLKFNWLFFNFKKDYVIYCYMVNIGNDYDAVLLFYIIWKNLNTFYLFNYSLNHNLYKNAVLMIFFVCLFDIY
jgi:hypothetical protein